MAETDGSRTKQIALLGLLVAGAGGYFGYQYGYRPRADKIAGLEERLESLQTQNRTARILVEENGEGDVERRLAAYRDQLVRVEGLIPSSEEVPELLDAISAEAQRTGVELSLIQPAGAVAEEYYTRRTYTLGVLGSYHQIGHFLARIASLPRIITPARLDVVVVEDETRSGLPRLEARFAIETYVLPSGSDVSESDVNDAETE